MREPEQEDEVLGKAYDARLMGRLWAFTRPHLRLVLATCALFPAVALLELSQPYLIKIAIDDHILRRDWAGLGNVAALFLLVLVALYALRATQAYLTQLTGQRVIHDLRAALFAHLQRQDARFYDRSPVGRLMTRVLNDGEAIQELFTSGVVALLGDVVVLTGVVVIMLGMNWKLALVTFALVPLLVLAAAYFRVRARDSYRVVRTRLARMNAFLQESLQGMSVIQLFAREARERETFGAALRGAPRGPVPLDVLRRVPLRDGGGPGLRRGGAAALVRGRAGGDRGAHLRRPGGVPRVHRPLLPPHPGPGRQVHGHAGRHGLGRAHLRPARHPPLHHLARPGR